MPRRSSTAESTTASKPGGLSRFQKFAIQTVNRKDLRNAPYNPRVISDRGKKLLRENLERVGLLEPVIWNKRTGNLVGGHQRLVALDSLEGRGDYELSVSVVDLDQTTEKEQNIFLNNPHAQGDYDLDKLGDLLSDKDISALHAGFSTAEVYQMFGESPFAEKSEEVAALSEQVKQHRELYRKLLERTTPENDCDFYFVVVFDSNESRIACSRLFDLDDNKFLDGRRLQEIVLEWRKLTGRDDVKEAKPASGGKRANKAGAGKDPAKGTRKPSGA